MKIRRWILFSALAVVAVAVMIFLFSAQDADVSGQNSRILADWLLRLLHPEMDRLTGAEQQKLRMRMQLYVRKAAHFSEFALLGMTLRLLLQWLRVRWKKSVSWAAGTLYAATDEIHQLFVSGRSCQTLDMAIDSLGVLTGVFVMVGLIRLFRSKKEDGAPKNTK